MKMMLKIAGMIISVPKKSPMKVELNTHGTESTKKPSIVRRLIPSIGNTKCFLINDNVPPVKPNAKMGMLKTGPSTQYVSIIERATKEKMIVRIPAAIGKPVVFLV